MPAWVETANVVRHESPGSGRTKEYSAALEAQHGNLRPTDRKSKQHRLSEFASKAVRRRSKAQSAAGGPGPIQPCSGHETFYSRGEQSRLEGLQARECPGVVRGSSDSFPWSFLGGTKNISRPSDGPEFLIYLALCLEFIHGFAGVPSKLGLRHFS